MTCVVENTKNISCDENGTLEPLNYRFDYPFPINDSGMCLRVRECILEYDKEERTTFGYKLHMNSIRNDRQINSHMRGIMEIWLANKNFQLVVNIDKAIAYMTNYLTKPEVDISFGMNRTILQIINKSNVNGLTTKAI